MPELAPITTIVWWSRFGWLGVLGAVGSPVMTTLPMPAGGSLGVPACDL